MAPFRRGKAQAARSRSSQTRGGKFAGRGGRTSTRKPISLNRLEEHTAIAGEAEAEDSTSEEGISNHGAHSSDSDVDVQNIKPYNSLLRCLGAHTQRGQPQRKKRKLEEPEIQEESLIPDNIQDVLETQDLANADEEAEASDLDEELDDVEEENGPFDAHFANQDEERLSQSIRDVKDNRWASEKATRLGLNVLRKQPLCAVSSTKNIPKHLFLKERLQKSWKVTNDIENQLQQEVMLPMFHYEDIFFPERQPGNARDLCDLAALHSLNHIMKTRSKILKGNVRSAKNDKDEHIECRDQGFTRPKVLIILPTKQSCVRYMDTISRLAEPEQVENKKQFQERFVQSQDDEFSEDKPDDFRELFAGNDDDMFRMGLKFTRKTMKYFSNFYTSDIIFASPLGLRMVLGSDNKKPDYDFLSSIEILIIDQADAMLMQNREHMEVISEHMNLQPKESHGCDYSRIRPWYLDGNARYLRQTIIFSAYNFPQLNKMYNESMLNVAGKMKYSRSQVGAVIGLGIQIRQTFSRFETATPASDPEDRFTYFTTAILPTLAKQSKAGSKGSPGVLLFVPLYADFVRLRNYFVTSSSTQNLSFGSISEYTSPQDVSRARSHFLSGRHSLLLYTERAHHFRRYRLRGVQKVIMYGLPENPIFYQEVVGGYLGRTLAEGGMLASGNGVRCLFSRFDILKLERIVGTERYISLLKDRGGDTFDFL